MNDWSRLPEPLEEAKSKTKGFLGSQGSGAWFFADILLSVLRAASSAVSWDYNPDKWGYEDLYYADGIPFPANYSIYLTL